MQVDGVGIQRKELSKIFERFYRVDKQLSQEVDGLNIIEYVVKAHNRSVSVNSQPGKGSLFSIILPLANSAAAEPLLDDGYRFERFKD